MGKTTAPNTNSEHGSRHGKNDPNILCVRKDSHPTEKCTGKTYPIFCVRILAVEALREEKTTPILPVDEQNNSKDANLQCMGAQQLVGGERKKTCVRLKSPRACA